MFSHNAHTSLSREEWNLQLLYIDSLTDVYNRRYYDEHFRDTEDTEGVVVIDVDNFKDINDYYGHATGDIVLQNIAKTILSCVRKTDTVIRYGGDEFVVIFYSIPADAFKNKLERIRMLVNRLVIDEYPEIQVSISVGGAHGLGKVKEMFNIADHMMYQAKNTKNQVFIQFLEKETNDI